MRCQTRVWLTWRSTLNPLNSNMILIWRTNANTYFIFVNIRKCYYYMKPQKQLFRNFKEIEYFLQLCPEIRSMKSWSRKSSISKGIHLIFVTHCCQVSVSLSLSIRFIEKKKKKKHIFFVISLHICCYCSDFLLDFTFHYIFVMRRRWWWWRLNEILDFGDDGCFRQ